MQETLTPVQSHWKKVNTTLVSARCQLCTRGYRYVFIQHGLSTKPCSTTLLCQHRAPVSVCIFVCWSILKGTHPSDHKCPVWWCCVSFTRSIRCFVFSLFFCIKLENTLFYLRCIKFQWAFWPLYWTCWVVFFSREALLFQEGEEGSGADSLLVHWLASNLDWKDDR